MSGVHLNKISYLSKYFRTSNAKYLLSCKCFCSSVTKRKKREDYFFDEKVQSILRRITGLDYEKIFRTTPKKLTPHKYEFVTDKQLKEMKEDAQRRAYEKLQMPPVMEVREPIDEVLCRDPELQGYLETKLIFTDISFSKHDRNRVITVRETDGTLRKADWDERYRMNQIFYPIEGRSLDTPKLFESPHLDKLLDEGSYVFVLDLACVQFEPDDPEYHRVTSKTYDHIKGSKSFHSLRSTRHFGPMAFYYGYNNDINELLVDMIERNLIDEAADSVKLLDVFHPDLGFTLGEKADSVQYIQAYIEKHKSPKTAVLELAFQAHLENVELKEKENALA